MDEVPNIDLGLQAVSLSNQKAISKKAPEKLAGRDVAVIDSSKSAIPSHIRVMNETTLEAKSIETKNIRRLDAQKDENKPKLAGITQLAHAQSSYILLKNNLHTTNSPTDIARDREEAFTTAPETKKLLEYAQENWHTKTSENIRNVCENCNANFQPFAEKMAACCNRTLENLRSAQTTESLHSIAREAIQEIKQIGKAASKNNPRISVELSSDLENRIMFELGAQTVDILFKEKPIWNDILKKFYRDETHPMDLQKSFRDPILHQQIGTILTTLIEITPDESLEKLLLEDPPINYNNFLKRMIGAYLEEKNNKTISDEGNSKNLLEIETILVQTETLRNIQSEYYSKLQIPTEIASSDLMFATATSQSGITLLDIHETIPNMDSKSFYQDESFTYLRIPEVEDRIVKISNRGYEALKKISEQSADDLQKVILQITEIFKDADHTITARTKSAQSILDKSGRICYETQSKDTPKYRTTKDIIDVNGCRITCANSEELGQVINTLQQHNYVFLELDNKYTTIRKDGAYKVIPCTLKDPKSGVIFELQITTRISALVSDLFHNIVYKREAIGLNPSEDQVKGIKRIQRLSAVVETLKLTGKKTLVADDLENYPDGTALPHH